MRDVVPVRLSDAERAQIAVAAGRRKLTLSGFIRQASLQASAVVEGKVSVKPAEPRERRDVVVLDEMPPTVDGDDLPAPHHFEGDACSRCGLHISDMPGRDRSCKPI